MPSIVEQPHKYCEMLVNFYLQMGYDYVPFEVRPNFPEIIPPNSSSKIAKEQNWVDEISGPIKTWKDYRRINWAQDNPINYELYDILGEKLPEG